MLHAGRRAQALPLGEGRFDFVWAGDAVAGVEGIGYVVELAEAVSLANQAAPGRVSSALRVADWRLGARTGAG